MDYKQQIIDISKKEADMGKSLNVIFDELYDLAHSAPPGVKSLEEIQKELERVKGVAARCEFDYFTTPEEKGRLRGQIDSLEWVIGHEE